MNLVLIGSPGAGKGTQAKRLSKRFNIAHISTGDLLREQMELKTEVGLKITDAMLSGKLVSDEIVISLLKERLKKDDCKNGCILDGYPRNVFQAEGLYDIIGKIDKVVLIDVKDDIIVDRMAGRRVCPKCGQMYHVENNPPKIAGICDECGTKLIQREDDMEQTVKRRLRIFHETTSPIIDYYAEKGLLLEVDGLQDIDKITQYLTDVLKEFV